jgi:hypothetical protein
MMTIRQVWNMENIREIWIMGKASNEFFLSVLLILSAHSMILAHECE